MSELSQSATITPDCYSQPENDPITEYTQWRSRASQLLMEANCAKEKGKLKKAEKLLSEARKITRDYYDPSN